MSRFRGRQHGGSLVELMVAMTLGLWLAGAALQLAWRSTQARQLQNAHAEMIDNAQLALQLLSRELQLAGYSTATGVAASGNTSSLLRALKEVPLLGCEQGFVSLSANTCAHTSSMALQVVYEADMHNTSPTTAGIPADCLGNAVVPASGVYVTRHRYFVQTGSTGRPELHCAAGTNTQPLVDNIEQLQVWFGEALATEPTRAVRYVSASQVSDWARVVAARVCVQVRSAEPVWMNDEVVSYADCSGQMQTSGRYARQSVSSTVVLRNKI